jgi:hypothetical protein
MTDSAASGYRSRCSILMSGGFDHSRSPEKSPIFPSKESFDKIHHRPSRKFAGRSRFRPRYPEPQGWPQGWPQGGRKEAARRPRVDAGGCGWMPGSRSETRRLCGVPSEREECCRVGSQGLHPGLVCDAPSAPLTDGVGSVLDREVYFSLAGYAGPGFHTWPQSHIPQDTAPKPLLRSRSPAKNSFGEAFGAATGVSDPRLQRSGSKTTAQAAKPPL